jgi:hypothetical protein
VVLIGHILSSAGWWGMAVVVAAFAVLAATAGDAALTGALHRSIGVAVWVTVVTGLVSAATGVLLGLGSRWGLVRYKWVLLKEVATVVMVVTDLLVVRSAAARAVAGVLEPGGLIGPAMGHVVVLGAATVLSVVKPFGRVRPDRPADPEPARPAAPGESVRSGHAEVRVSLPDV